MNFYKNNYFQSQQYKSLNKNIFNNKIIEINKKNFFILRSRINNKLKLDFSKKSLGTEFKGILEENRDLLFKTLFSLPVDEN